MKRNLKGTPRYQAAVRRTALAKESRAGMGDAASQLMKENKLRAIVGKAPQALGGGLRKRKFA